MRTVDATLTAALAAGTGTPFLWAGIGYSGGQPLHVVPVLSYVLTGQTLEMELPYNGDSVGDQTHIWLSRGVSLAGTDYYITTSRFRIASQRYLPNGHQVAKGILFPKQYYAVNGNVSYEMICNNLCTAYGKTAAYRSAYAWRDYIFFPVGKSLILNDPNYIANLLAQKYLIFYCDNGGEEVLFYSCDGSLGVNPDLTITAVDDFYIERTSLRNRLFMWRDEAGTLHSYGSATNPIHNLGYLESTATHPARTSPSNLVQAHIRPDLRILDGDIISINGWNVFALVTEQYLQPSGSSRLPRWETIVTANEIFSNTAGGALPSTIERISNYTPLNTSQFNGILSNADNNLQAAMDTLDNHTH
jgi:hypothetical protein